jgi:hypothetical protein
MELIKVGMEEKDRMRYLLKFHENMRLVRRLNKIDGIRSVQQKN